MRKNSAAVSLGRKGGQSKSEAKRLAAQENGKKGGRPKGKKK
jgi:general stress protein YciG